MAETIEAVLDRLSRAEQLDVYSGSVLNADVELVGQLSGGDIPDDYRHFLITVGFATWIGHSVFGMYDLHDERFPASYNFSVIEQTRNTRELHRDDTYPFFDSSIVIGSDGMGGHFLLLSDRAARPNPVVWVNRDEMWVITKSWPSFTAFLADQLSTAEA